MAMQSMHAGSAKVLCLSSLGLFPIIAPDILGSLNSCKQHPSCSLLRSPGVGGGGSSLSTSRSHMEAFENVRLSGDPGALSASSL